MVLETIEEYNARKLREYHNKGVTGIACPVCGDELKDESPGVMLLSNPPQKTVNCFGCNYHTTVYA